MTIPRSLDIVWKNGSESAYETARTDRVFNQRLPRRYPIAIARVRSQEEIIQAVETARQKNLRISIRSGGHSWAAWSLRNDALLIELGNYKKIEFEPSTGIIAVSPSTTGRELNEELARHGLFFPGGHCPTVALGGFLLQGGMGWVCRGWGWACQYVKGIDVVTVNGATLHCDAHENEDLYWAARGAGPGFPAIITCFYLEAKPMPLQVCESVYIFPSHLFKRALRWAISLSADFDIDTEIVCTGSFLPGSTEVSILVLFTTYKPTRAEAIEVLMKAERSVPEGYVQKWFARPTSLAEQYISQEVLSPSGHRYASDNVYVDNNADVADVLEEGFTKLPNQKTFALWFSMAPTSRRTLPDMALSMQSDHYFAIYTIWESESDDYKYQSWLRGVMGRIEPHSIGQYLGDADFQERNTKYWADSNWQRLQEIRKLWDPSRKLCSYLDDTDSQDDNNIANRVPRAYL